MTAEPWAFPASWRDNVLSRKREGTFMGSLLGHGAGIEQCGCTHEKVKATCITK